MAPAGTPGLRAPCTSANGLLPHCGHGRPGCLVQPCSNGWLRSVLFYDTFVTDGSKTTLERGTFLNLHQGARGPAPAARLGAEQAPGGAASVPAPPPWHLPCLPRGCPAPPPATSPSQVKSWMATSWMGISLRKNGFWHRGFPLTTRLFLSHLPSQARWQLQLKGLDRRFLRGETGPV